MKIAVQLFGHLRTYQKCYKALRRHLLDKYDCDVFMHTWSSIDHNTQTWHKNKMRSAAQSIVAREDKIREMYRLKDLLIEEQKPQDLGCIDFGKKTMSLYGLRCMWHSMTAVNRLREKYEQAHHVQYDFVVMLRPDILLKKDFNIRDYIKNLPETEVDEMFFTGGNLHHYLLRLQSIAAVDILFFAKPNVLTGVLTQLEKISDTLTPGMKIKGAPEYRLIQATNHAGYQPVLITYTSGDCFDILRSFSWASARKQLVRLRIKNGKVQLYLFPILIHPIIRFQIDLCGLVEFDFCLGNLRARP